MLKDIQWTNGKITMLKSFRKPQNVVNVNRPCLCSAFSTLSCFVSSETSYSFSLFINDKAWIIFFTIPLTLMYCFLTIRIDDGNQLGVLDVNKT